jgi:hypothetical protein
MTRGFGAPYGSEHVNRYWLATLMVIVEVAAFIKAALPDKPPSNRTPPARIMRIVLPPLTRARCAPAAPAASALDTGTGLIAGWISTGSHDGGSPGPARPWDR